MGDEQAGNGLDGVDSTPWLEQAEELEALLRTPEVWTEVPPELERRVVGPAAGLNGHQLHVVPLHAGALEDRPQRPAVRRRFRRPALLMAAVAASIAAAVGVGVVSNDPEPAVVALDGTSLAADARARVELRETSSGVELTLRAEGLAGAAPGRFYEAWVKGEKGAVAIGTFHLRAGAGEVVLWSGVDLKDYPAITVTVQSEGAGPASSGQVVLTGVVPPGDR